MPDLPRTVSGSSSAPAETKPRGANRSTKVAGKLKVLPEQPEDLPVIGAKTGLPKPPVAKDYTESGANTGESEDGDVEESEQSEDEDVEVCLLSCLVPEMATRSERVVFKQTGSFLSIKGLQSNFVDTRGYCAERRSEINEKESQVAAESDGLCNCKVSCKTLLPMKSN